MADDVTAKHFRWLDQVGDDHAIPASAFKLAYYIGKHINRATGLAWPGQERLSKLIGADVRTVRRLADLLAERGHLEIQKRKGSNHANVYRALHQTPASGSDDATQETRVRRGDEHAGRPSPVQSAHGPFATETPDIPHTHSRHQCPQNLLEQLQKLKSKEARKNWFKENQKSFNCHISSDTPPWQRWCAYLGHIPPTDRRFGWNFPGPDPPG